jgi:hypothetical protein
MRAGFCFLLWASISICLFQRPVMAQAPAGTAIVFDGARSIAVAPSTLTPSDGITVEAWLNPTNLSWQQQVIVRQGPAHEDWMLSVTDVSIFFSVRVTWGDGGFGYYYTSVFLDPRVFSEGHWHHIAGTFDGNQLAIFLDGVERTRIWEQIHYLNPQAGPTSIGGSYDGVATNSFFNGALDEIRIWRVARNGVEICETMNQRLTGAEPNLAAYWHMDEGGGSLAFDSSGHNLTASLLNGARWVPSGALRSLPVVETLHSTIPTTNSVTLAGTVSVCASPTSAWFEYGLTTNYDRTTVPTNLANGSAKLPIVQEVGGLQADTWYHFRCVAATLGGQTGGADMMFKTAGAPKAETMSPWALTLTNATIQGSVNPNGLDTVVWFEWGGTLSYGTSTPLQFLTAGTNALAVIQAINGFPAGSQTHYRIVASNSFGMTLGRDSVFSTSTGALVWALDFGSPISSSPAIGPDGTIYIGAAGNLFAITKIGATNWSLPIGGWRSSSPSIGGDGTIYISTDSANSLTAVNPNGLLRWTYPSQSGAGSVAVGFSNEVYVQGRNFLYCISSAGTLIWNAPIAEDYLFQSPSLSTDGTVFIGCAICPSFLALNADASPRWNLPIAGGDAPSVAADGTIYTGERWSPLKAISPAGELLWSNTEALSPGPAAIARDGTIYVGTLGDNSLFALTPGGLTKWRAPITTIVGTNVPPTSPAIDSAGIIYYAGWNALYAIQPDGQTIWTFSPHDYSVAAGSPVIAPGGMIYIPFGTKLFAISGTNSIGDAPWPMYMQNPRHTGKVEKPSIHSPRQGADGTFAFDIRAQVGRALNIQMSSDLSSWTLLTNIPITTVPTVFIDEAPAPSRRFYRAVSN